MMNRILSRTIPLRIRIYFDQRPNLRKIVSNVGWLSFDRVIRLCVGVLLGAWIARYLGPDQFGLLNYAVAFVALFSPLATLGLDTIVVRDIARNPACRDETLGTIFVLKAIGGLSVIVLTIGTISVVRQGDYISQWLVGITALGAFAQAFDAIDLWFQSEVRSKYSVYAKNAAFMAIALAKIVMILLRAPLIAFACAGLAEVVLGAIGMIVVYRMMGQRLLSWHFSVQRALHLLKDSWPLILASICTYIYSKIDQVMLGQMVNTTSLGIYSVAVKLSETFDFIPVVLSASVLPLIVKTYEMNEASFMKSLQKVFDLMALSWFVIAVIVSLTAHFIVLTLYGDAYAYSAVILSIYIWAQFGTSFGLARSLYINVKGLFKLSLVISILGAILNIALNLILIPRYEAMGATIATLLTYFCVVILANFVFKDLRALIPMLLRSLVIPKAFIRLVTQHQ